MNYAKNQELIWRPFFEDFQTHGEESSFNLQSDSMTEYKNPNLVLETAKVEPGKVAWRSPSNLAIVKYWGKRGEQLPANPSLSLTLTNAVTETELSYRPKATGDTRIQVELSFQGEPKEPFRRRVEQYFERLVEIYPFLRQLEFSIRTGNSFPHSSGIASSASAMSALALCLCSLEEELFETDMSDAEFDRKASYLARLGSGSACRSIFPVAALWGKTLEVEDSSDEYAVPMKERVHEVFHEFHDDILIVRSGSKKVSSSAGHRLMEDNPFAEPRYAQARKRLSELLSAMRRGDVETFGKIAEAEALSLHGLMMSSPTPYFLLSPSTLSILEKIQSFRQDSGHPVFFSLDAGPNVHVLYPEEVIHDVRPFVESELVPLCEEQQWLPDWVGEGPVQL